MSSSDGLEPDLSKEEEFHGRDQEGEKDVRKNRANRGGWRRKAMERMGNRDGEKSRRIIKGNEKA